LSSHKYVIAIIVLFLFYHVSNGQPDSSRIFEKAKGTLSHPIESFKKLLNSDSLKDDSRNHYGISNFYYSDNADSVKAIYEGRVVAVVEISVSYAVITKFGDYFITYFGLTRPPIKKGEYVLKNQYIGNLINYDSGEYSYELVLIMSHNEKEVDPSMWLKK
jgi:hypothetical protein